MREKVLKLVVAFEETTNAIEAEQYFQEHEIEGRMIPLPGAVLSAGCGLAWAAPLKERELIEKKICKKELSEQKEYMKYSCLSRRKERSRG